MLSDILGVKVDLVEKIALKPALRQRILDEAVVI
jgi:predicted nucleotidyltransferase